MKSAADSIYFFAEEHFPVVGTGHVQDCRAEPLELGEVVSFVFSRWN